MQILEFIQHRCAIPGYDNDTFIPQDYNHAHLINNTIPPSSDGTSSYDKCHLYSQGSNGTIGNGADRRITKCSSWVYDPSVYTNTIGIQVYTNIIGIHVFTNAIGIQVYTIGIQVYMYTNTIGKQVYTK